MGFIISYGWVEVVLRPFGDGHYLSEYGNDYFALVCYVDAVDTYLGNITFIGTLSILLSN